MNNNWIDICFSFLKKRTSVLTTTFLILIFFMPIDSVKIDYFRPTVAAICVYFWTIRQPDNFSYLSAFFIGFIVDIYSSNPIGSNALLLMILVAIVRKWGKNLNITTFWAEWLLFSVFFFCLILFKWFFLVLCCGNMFPFSITMLNFLSTVAFYPLISYVNIFILNKIEPVENNEL